MPVSTSRYLDATRALAAVLVLLGHAGAILHAPLGHLGDFDGEAVAIFFVISGYVIAFVSHGRSATCSDYVVARCARVLPVVLIALGFTFLVDSWGVAVSPAAYAAAAFYHPPSAFSFVACLTFMSELWGYHIVFGSNEPYWSLVFEVWYYATWGVLVYARGLWRPALVLLLVLVSGPRIFAFFPLWLIGVACYYLQQKPLFRSISLNDYLKIPLALALVALAVYLKYAYFVGVRGMFMFNDRNLLYFYFLGTVFGVSILLLTPDSGRTQSKLGTLLAGLRPMFGWVAGISFTLYLVHEPTLQLIAAILPQAIANGVLSLVALPVVVLVAAAVALASERPRRHYRELILWVVAGRKGWSPAVATTPVGD